MNPKPPETAETEIHADAATTPPESAPPAAPPEGAPAPHGSSDAPAVDEGTAASADGAAPPAPAASEAPPLEQAEAAAGEPAVEGTPEPEQDANPAGAAAPKVADLSPAACAAALTQQFPALFGAGVLLPVKLRIQTDIQLRAPGTFSRKALSLYLHRHTTSTAYIRALLAAAHRFDLDGQPAGEISEEHRAAAVAELDRRKAIVQERRAAQRQQQRPVPPARGAQKPDGIADGQAAQAPDAGTAPPAQPRTERPPGARPPRPPRPEGPRRAPGGERTGGAQGAEGGRPGNRPEGGRAGASPDRGRRPSGPGPARPDARPRGPADTHGPRPPGHDRGPRDDGGRPWREQPTMAPTSASAEAPITSTGDPVADAARRERSALLRTFESSTLTKSNFLVLKRMTEADLDAQLALARQERQQGPQRDDRPPRR